MPSEVSSFCSLRVPLLLSNHLSPLALGGPEHVRSIVMKIESATGMGKTRLLQEMKTVAERKRGK